MAGITFTATQLNQQAGLLVQSLWTNLEEVRRFKLWLDDSTHTDAILTASPYSVAAGDMTAIRAAFADLGGSTGLHAVAHGSYVPGGVNNFFFNAKSLAGLNYAG